MSGAATRGTRAKSTRLRGLDSYKPPRCGVCDRPSVLATCDACAEPMCAEHVTSRVVAGVREYVCTLCAHMQAEDVEARQASVEVAS